MSTGRVLAALVTMVRAAVVTMMAAALRGPAQRAISRSEAAAATVGQQACSSWPCCKGVGARRCSSGAAAQALVAAPLLVAGLAAAADKGAGAQVGTQHFCIFNLHVPGW